MEQSRPLDDMSPAARAWFRARFEAPTPVQQEGWCRIAAGEHALLLAPTGSGKTLAAFFYCIDRLTALAEDAKPGVRVLYVSPLKALVYDIERNLRQPLAGIAQHAGALGLSGSLRLPRVAVRTGDTSPKERRQQGRDPAEILVTTPESLYLILGSKQRETLATVETVIVDEIHALAATKRGAHLGLSLERVAALCAADPQRVGLSATARPADEIARFLGGDRRVSIVDMSRAPDLEVTLSIPVPDMTRPDAVEGVPKPPQEGEEIAASSKPTGSLWPAIHPRLLELIRSHRSTIVFVNSRGLCEQLAQRLNELAEEDLVRAHHGSVAHHRRLEIETALKEGTLRCIVATSSLELGIDMGAVDLVVLVESPGSVARGLQRVGRAGHQVGAPSVGQVFPKHRADLLEATVVVAGMREGAVEPLRVPRNPLDVLAQQIVAMSAVESLELDALEAQLRRAASFRDLSREMLCGVLDMLAGRYPSTDFAELRPRVVWDRQRDRIEARKGARQLALVSGGTIPDRGLYPVFLGTGGPRIGELDEEMVYESRAGETITLGASTWRIDEIGRDRVLVSPAPGEPGKLPFWHGEGPGRPVELGQRVGAFVAEVAKRCGTPRDLGEGRAAGEAWLRDEHGLDDWAARNLVDYLADQESATGALPTDRRLTLERFRDELGDWRICLLSPFGARVHAPWALAIEAALSLQRGFEVRALWSDDGIMLRFADADALPGREALLPDPDEVEDLVVAQLSNSSLFAGQFRENAARALLLPRRRPGARTPLWTQRLRAANLLAVAREFPAFPIVLETYRACLQDVFDLPALTRLLSAIRQGEVAIDEVETRSASPFARNLVFAYTASFLYQGDTPLAERRAHALTLDRHMLRDLLGQEDLRSLLDAERIAELEAEISGRAAGRRARHVDGLHDLLRQQGDLSLAELRERCEDDPSGWLDELLTGGRAISLQLRGEERFAAAEDAGLFRDALGVAAQGSIAEVFLEPVEDPMGQLVLRFARQRGPFTTLALAERYGLVPAQLEPVLDALAARERLLAGEFHPDGAGPEWCEPDVLRRLRRLTLAKLRDEIAPVDDRTLARFLAQWHGIGNAGPARLEGVVEQLEGLPLSFAELERLILPARIEGFDPHMLDELGALGQTVWIGHGAIGERDGRIALYRRERVGLLVEAPVRPDDLAPLQCAILDQLEDRGASFFAELLVVAGNPPRQELLDALWDLVWRGLATNDTFAPLRARSAPRRASPRRGRRGSADASTAGRWSSVAKLLSETPSETQRAHARALMLLERHGIASRDVLGLEDLRGGFSALYPVYREMEEVGKLRRGHFAEALSGAQFAFAGVVDRLRGLRETRGEQKVSLLAATDPANPYGAQLPWPESRGEGSPRRGVGASVVLVDGALVLYLDKSGQRLLSFDAGDAGEQLGVAASALAGLFQQRVRRSLRIEQVDGVAAARSPLADVFLAAGFRVDYKGLVLERFESVR